MTQGIYSLYDRKSMSYSTVFCSPNDDCAIRQVKSTVRCVPELAQFSGDYVLHCLGLIDSKGICFKESTIYPRVVIEVSDCKTDSSM